MMEGALLCCKSYLSGPPNRVPSLGLQNLFGVQRSSKITALLLERLCLPHAALEVPIAVKGFTPV